MDVTELDSLKEFEKLSNETKLILEFVKDKKSKNNRPSTVNQNDAKRTNSAKKRKEIQQSINLSKSLTQNLFSSSSNRVTFSEEPDQINVKINKKVENIPITEKHAREMNFGEEMERVIAKTDTFVPKPGVSAKDVEKERNRLTKLEEHSRLKSLYNQNETILMKHYLQEDRAALKIQALYRGSIGRRRVELIKSLTKLTREDEHGDWVEVVDAKSNSTWYYNKTTNLSQWNKPTVISKTQSKSKHPKKKQVIFQSDRIDPRKLNTKSRQNLNANEKTMEVTMSLPQIDVVQQSKRTQNNNLLTALSIDGEDSQLLKNRAKHEINQILGIDKITSDGDLLAPDGSFKPQLRTTVLDTLISTRFDSVSTVLADNRWIDDGAEPFAEATLSKIRKKHSELITEEKIDYSRAPLVSVVTFNKKKKQNRIKPLESSDFEQLNPDSKQNARRLQQDSQKSFVGLNDETIQGVGDKSNEQAFEPQNLTFKEVEHPGFEVQQQEGTMCFGCWSAGINRKCAIHEMGMKIPASQTMLLCRNWDLDIMRRKYRSEEMQEIFLRKESSLRYDVKRKRFFTIIEKKHPIYRSITFLLDRFNNRMILFEKIKRWLFSFSDALRVNKIINMSNETLNEYDAISAMLRMKRSFANQARIQRYTKVHRGLLIPIPPITGLSWPERTGDAQYLFKHKDIATHTEVDLITILPLPDPKKLYEPRTYHLPVPKSIPMPSASHAESAHEGSQTSSILNEIMDVMNPASWLERLSASLSRDTLRNAEQQIQAITPAPQLELVKRTKKSTPVTIKFATLGRKPTANNMAIGGLPMELLINQLVSTYMTVQYGNLMVMEKSPVSPGISPEITITFVSVVMPPTIPLFVNRPLEHPLNYRHTPTITINSSALPHEKSLYGLNRPEQTGEQEAHGFRTTTWCPMLLTYTETDPQVFTPGLGIVSLNDTKANTPTTTHADYTYPFCEPSTRDNSTLDFYHLLLTGVVSASKPQVFTALTVQEAGQFLKAYRTDVPMGSLVVSVYRSWAFTQADTIQEFKTDDNISYWYHRKTGQTFWERPLYKEETPSPLIGGTLLDMVHEEDATMMRKGDNGTKPRYLQGEFRQLMLHHHEDKADATKRRKSAAATLHTAKMKGIVPDIYGGASMANNPRASQDMGSRFDFSKGNNYSNIVNSESSNVFESGLPQILDINNESPQLANKSNTQHNARPQVVRGSRLEDDNTHNPQMQTSTMSFEDNRVLVDQNRGFMNQSPSTPKTGILPDFNYKQQTHGIPQTSNDQMIGASFPGIDPNMMMNLTATISKMFQNLSTERNTPQDMISMGLGIGMALMQTNVVQGVVGHRIEESERVQTVQEVHTAEDASYLADARRRFEPPDTAADFIPVIPEDSSSHNSIESFGIFPQIGMSTTSTPGLPYNQLPTLMGGQPIGVPNPTIIGSSKVVLNHHEEEEQKLSGNIRTAQSLTALEKARNLQVVKPTITPDLASIKHLYVTLPLNAEDAMRDEVPLLAYPEITTISTAGGVPNVYSRKSPAGLGTSFLPAEEAPSQLMVKGSQNQIRRTVMPLPSGFFDAIVSKHVAQQTTDYLPHIPNIPQSRTIGRVKPRSAAADWLLISFDPWSAGKNPLGTEFIPSLLSKSEKLFEGSAMKPADAFDSLKQAAVSGAYVSVEDEQGIAEQRGEITKAAQLAEDFKKLCSLCRHNKFADAEQLINQPDWNVPIDYQDDRGNTLLHTVCQNGNKRMAKLCLRRGAQLNLQNLTGQTPLHFAYGYGYSALGDYLRDVMGADDSILNKDGLTCYEGLGAREIELL